MPKILDYIDALRLDNTVSTGIQFIMWPLITICPGEEASGEELVINEKTRFYIGKEAETRSRVQYGDKEEPLWPVILGSAALILFGIVVFYILIRR